MAINYLGGNEHLKIVQERDILKNNKCIENNCKLFRVKYEYTEDDYLELVTNINNYILNNKFIPILRKGSKITII